MAAVLWGARETPYLAVRPILAEGESWYHAAWRGSNAIPSWSWRGLEGQETEVEIHSMAETVELFLNGESLGKNRPVNGKAVFSVRYLPGELKAVAYSEDGSRAESALRSAAGTIRAVIAPETKPEIGKVLFVDISLRGENGEVESHADNTLHLTVSGGRLMAFGSAKPCTEEVFHSGSYTTCYGRSHAAILVEREDLVIQVSGEHTEAQWTGSAVQV